MSESQKIEITFKEVELTKLDLKPGDTLAMTIKSDDIDEHTVNSLKQNMGAAFPRVNVLIFGIGLDNELNFTVISENKEISSCSTTQYCVNCNCGKKELKEQGEENES